MLERIDSLNMLVLLGWISWRTSQDSTVNTTSAQCVWVSPCANSEEVYYYLSLSLLTVVSAHARNPSSLRVEGGVVWGAGECGEMAESYPPGPKIQRHLRPVHGLAATPFRAPHL